MHGPALLLAALALAGCGLVSTSAPPPTPADFPGILTELDRQGIAVADWASGEPGCDDPVLTPTAITFRGHGLDQAEPVELYVFIFRNQASYDRLRSDVDICTLAYPAAGGPPETLDAAPFVLAGPGPWPPAFRAALRRGLVAAAGG
jgi:hypothetical protein